MFIDSGIKMIIVIKTEAKILDTVPTGKKYKLLIEAARPRDNVTCV